MLLNSLGQAYATLLFKLLAQCHPQVLRTQKKLNVGHGYATLLFKLLTKRHQQVLQTKKGTMSICIPSHYPGGTYTVKKAVELLDVPSRNTSLMLKKYNSNVEFFCLSTYGLFFPLCYRMKKFDVRAV
jgi:hypothetical protein